MPIGIYASPDESCFDIDVDKKCGGGVTEDWLKSVVGEMPNSYVVKTVRVIISGNENCDGNVKDTKGKPLVSSSADILEHELMRHALPATCGV